MKEMEQTDGLDGQFIRSRSETESGSESQRALSDS